MSASDVDGRELARVLWAFGRTEPPPLIVAAGDPSSALAVEVARALHARLVNVDAEVGGRTVIVVEDGITPFRVVRATLRHARRRGAARLVLATPTADSATLVKLARDADQIVCTQTIGEDEAQRVRSVAHAVR